MNARRSSTGRTVLAVTPAAHSVCLRRIALELGLLLTILLLNLRGLLISPLATAG